MRLVHGGPSGDPAPSVTSRRSYGRIPMLTALDVTASCIRLVERRNGRIVRLDQWPVASGADPVTALAACPLPPGLGPVRVALAHDDVLLKIMCQPDGPHERLDQLVRFEAGDLGGDEPASIAWMRLPGDGEARLLVQITRLRLIERVRQALAPHGATLAGLCHPALGLSALGISTEEGAPPRGTEALVDVGGRFLHVALMRDSQVVLLRTHQPGMEALVDEVADARSISPTDARTLVRNLAAGSPDDLKDLVHRQAGQVSAAVTAVTRFARTQLDLPTLEAERILVCGAGALAHGFLEALAHRAGRPVQLINPFAGQSLSMTTADLDHLGGLPSPWAVGIGLSMPQVLALDALADERRARQTFWRGPGALAAAACVATLFSLVGLALAHGRAVDAEEARQGIETALPQARDLASRQERARSAQAAAAARIQWLDGQRRIARITPELLGTIGGLQDPSLCPVVLKSLTIQRLPAGSTVAEITGHATAGTKGTAAALHTFEAGLTKRYPVIANLEALPTAIERDRQPFRYLLTIPDPTP